MAADTIVITAAFVTDMDVEIFASPESCWEANDGTATAAVSGGFGEISYLWDDPADQTTATAIGLEAEETYSVIITDTLGCTLTAFAFIEPTEGCLFISTALTPNGDGSNDVWLIGGLEYFPDAAVQVYNRWGQLLFESRGYSVAWDGTHNGNKVAVADYYFIIDHKEGEAPITGTVTVKY
ncbi:MAG: T9SS type B sorting domain-containing protein [Flavobacteriales bacterium]|nr:T9SS type B sorting domain-containing protein [Flavobacteriales bacterium]